MFGAMVNKPSNKAQPDVTYDYVFVDEESFNKYSPKSFNELATNFLQYKE